MLPFGPEPVKTFAEGWFDLAAAQNPKPKTVAIVATDAEFQHKAAESAREHAKATGIDIVYDRAYPPTTVDFTPIVRAVQAAQPDLVYISSYPSDTVGIPAFGRELGLDTKMLGGGLAGLQAAAIKMQLGEMANGIVNVDLWEPVPTMQFPGVMDFIKKYQARAPAEGVDLLGYFLPPFAYSELQILGDAIDGDQEPRRRQARRIHAHATPSTRSWATSPSGPTANGPRRGRSGCSTTASRGTMSSSSADRRPSRSWRRRNTRPAK